jgi:hypothetical protein
VLQKQQGWRKQARVKAYRGRGLFLVEVVKRVIEDAVEIHHEPAG